jgi:hypothetical protein
MEPMPPTARSEMTYAGHVALNYLRGAGWSWFGTWFLAGIAALAGASMGVRRLGGSPHGHGPGFRAHREELPAREVTIVEPTTRGATGAEPGAPLPPPPFTPAPSA